MASINYATREISCKIVYYGPGLSGKTTNLQVIHRKIPQETKSEMVSLATETDRTLFFDFLPLDLGSIKGFATKFQLYTVPGQVYYNATRKLVLRGVDGVVFVADSQRDKMQENIDSLKNLQENLKEYGIDLGTVPFVLQYNKRDLPGIATIMELDQYLNWHKVPTFEAQAHQGVGVFTTLKAIGKIVIDTFNAKYTARQSSRRPSAGSDVPATPPPAPAPQARPVAPMPPQMAAPGAPPPPRPTTGMPSMPPPPRPAPVYQAPPPVAPLPPLNAVPNFQQAQHPPMPPPVPPPVAPQPVRASNFPPPPSAGGSFPQPFPSAPQGAPQITGFAPPVPPSQPQVVPGMQQGYNTGHQPPPPVPPVPGLMDTRGPYAAPPVAPTVSGMTDMRSPFPPPPVSQVPGLQNFQPTPTPYAPPPTTPGSQSPSPSHGSSDGVKKKSRLDGSIDPSDLDAEIARYERELAEQKRPEAPRSSQVVTTPNVNPNLEGGDPMNSAFLTPDELTRLQGPDSYPTRRMPLGPK